MDKEKIIEELTDIDAHMTILRENTAYYKMCKSARLDIDGITEWVEERIKVIEKELGG